MHREQNANAQPLHNLWSRNHPQPVTATRKCWKDMSMGMFGTLGFGILQHSQLLLCIMMCRFHLMRIWELPFDRWSNNCSRRNDDFGLPRSVVAEPVEVNLLRTNFQKHGDSAIPWNHLESGDIGDSIKCSSIDLPSNLPI